MDVTFINVSFKTQLLLILPLLIFLHLCLYIKEIKPFCWTLSSVFPESFNHVLAQLPIQGHWKG